VERQSSHCWLLLLLSATVFVVVAKALAYVTALPEAYGFTEQIPVYSQHRFWLLSHITGGALALTCGTAQLIVLRFRKPGVLHRWTGCIYAISVMVAGIAGLRLAPHAWGGIANSIAFALLAGLWIFATLKAVDCVRHGNAATHRIWIARSFALTLAGITLRAEMGLFQLLGLSFEEAYQVAPWTCWVLNLIAVEWLRTAAPQPPSPPRCRK
jgi:hypothetical protein